MFPDAKRAAWAEINLSNIDHNIKEIKKKAAGSRIIAVVKADGYGHGAIAVSKVMLENGVNTLAVATLQEAIALREGGFSCPIVLLGITPDIYSHMVVAYNLIPTLSGLENGQALSKAAYDAGTVLQVLIAVDTGMGRIGFLPEDTSVPEILSIGNLRNLHIKGLMSHFATADEKDKTYAQEQLKKYKAFVQRLAEAGLKPEIRSLANSGAIMEIPHAYFDAVRPGIILYGCYPSQEVSREALALQPAMSVKANILHLKKVPAGSSISYGRNFTTERESLIATLPLGYADGYARIMSGKARAIVNGAYAPVVGNICMDQCMIDVTHLPQVKLGDEVVLMGSQGGLTISAEEIGAKTGTINYEVVCRFGQRLPKVYTK